MDMVSPSRGELLMERAASLSAKTVRSQAAVRVLLGVDWNEKQGTGVVALHQNIEEHRVSAPA